MSFSGLLRPESTNRLLKNFRVFLSLKKKLEDLQQEFYHCILARPSTDSDNCITLVRKSLFPFFNKTKVGADFLLPCVHASGVPVDNIETIKATLWREVTTSDWESFKILTRGGAVIQEIQGDAHYSPVIHQLIEQGKLLKLG